MKMVIKKDGRIQDFSEEKLRSSILKAFASIKEVDDYANTKASNIVNHILEDTRDEITSTELGDIVETTVVGTVLAGGNPLGALVGLGVGLLQTGVQYAQAYDRLNLERSIEEASLGIQRRRAATTNSRSSQ